MIRDRFSSASPNVELIVDGYNPDLVPSDQTMYEDLLWAFGAWETLEQMNAAMATRVYAVTPDGKVGFRLVK